MSFLQKISLAYKDQIKRKETILLTPAKEFRVLELQNGRTFVETLTIDEEGTILEELLVKNSDAFILLKRKRSGDFHHSMKFYERDNKFPIGSRVKL